MSAPVLVTIAENLSKMELQVNVAEADIGRISHLVVNDIGTGVPSDTLDRIIAYVATRRLFRHLSR